MSLLFSSDECCPSNTSIPVTSNCSKCSDDNDICEKCSIGYYINDGDGSCVKCEEHTCCPGNTHNEPSATGCLDCTDDYVNCYSCIKNTTLRDTTEGKSCLPCSSDECCGEGNKGDIGENCSSCSSDMSKCSSCETGYKLSSTGTCVKEKGKEGGTNVGLIVGVSVGAVVLIGVVIVIIVYFVIRSKNRNQTNESAIELSSNDDHKNDEVRNDEDQNDEDQNDEDQDDEADGNNDDHGDSIISGTPKGNDEV